MRTFLEFSGWIELDENALMDYIGNGDPKRITVKEWQQLPEKERAMYVTSEGFDILYRDSVNSDFIEWHLDLVSDFGE